MIDTIIKLIELRNIIVQANTANLDTLQTLNDIFQEQAHILGLPANLDLLTAENQATAATTVEITLNQTQHDMALLNARETFENLTPIQVLTGLMDIIAQANTANPNTLQTLNDIFQEQAHILGLPANLDLLTAENQATAATTVEITLNQTQHDMALLNARETFENLTPIQALTGLMDIIAQANTANPNTLQTLNDIFQEQAHILGLPTNLDLLNATNQVTAATAVEITLNQTQHDMALLNARETFENLTPIQALTGLMDIIAQANTANPTTLQTLNDIFQEQAHNLGLPANLDLLTAENQATAATAVAITLNQTQHDIALHDAHEHFAHLTITEALTELRELTAQANTANPTTLQILNDIFQEQAHNFGLPANLDLLNAENQQIADVILVNAIGQLNEGADIY
ncbi:hypothetical protein [Candidatus Trichorickettsia mobilis]|uniref:hypothetical protein n=1 Tax=Candidatus Trichorickettsia mobilis TaxID=1346319 RepID=UPI002931724D|nr:hypothetical protein [Candidatus Trichorickettsia mobilis]